MELLRMSTLILFSASVLKIHWPLFAIVLPLLLLGWPSALTEMLCMCSTGAQLIFEVHSVWACEQGPWYGNILPPQCVFFPGLSCLGSKSDSKSGLLVCWDQFCWLFDWDCTWMLFFQGGLNTSYKTNPRAVAASLIAEYCCAASANEQKQPDSSQHRGRKFSLPPLSFTSPALSYKYSSAWAQMNNARTANN